MSSIREFLPANPSKYSCQIMEYVTSMGMLLIEIRGQGVVFSLTFIGTKYIESPTAWIDASFELKSHKEKVQFFAQTPSLQHIPKKGIDEIFNLYTIESVGVKIVAGDVGRTEGTLYGVKRN